MTSVSPVTKTARQAQIAGILARTAVRSQEELAEPRPTSRGSDREAHGVARDGASHIVARLQQAVRERDEPFGDFGR